ncbi:MAG: DUF2069 domain-containing protein [Aliiglaciecola sp.]|uniref:DUF2069 domain-containing protein n=1 Tax=Aliiglaciecola sp. M165 TaxID=2593649 RepID=UPI00117D73A2|nr:DUF2069 domain-containing protein [Aliiglaciecola sp. M165]TRY30185.1 DUF2069 domain-containing protein [Aliiglaciecola sp. M165]
MQLNTSFYRKLALISYFGLLIWVPIWHLFLAEPVGRSLQFEVFLAVVWTIPLLLPLRGIVKGLPYTHAWANFIVMFYIIHGLTSIYAVENETIYALIELIFSTGMFVGCSVYARKRGKELGQGLPKLKEVMAQEKQRFER